MSFINKFFEVEKRYQYITRLIIGIYNTIFCLFFLLTNNKNFINLSIILVIYNIYTTVTFLGDNTLRIMKTIYNNFERKNSDLIMITGIILCTSIIFIPLLVFMNFILSNVIAIIFSKILFFIVNEYFWKVICIIFMGVFSYFIGYIVELYSSMCFTILNLKKLKEED